MNRVLLITLALSAAWPISTTAQTGAGPTAIVTRVQYVMQLRPKTFAELRAAYPTIGTFVPIPRVMQIYDAKVQNGEIPPGGKAPSDLEKILSCPRAVSAGAASIDRGASRLGRSMVAGSAGALGARDRTAPIERRLPGSLLEGARRKSLDGSSTGAASTSSSCVATAVEQYRALLPDLELYVNEIWNKVVKRRAYPFRNSDDAVAVLFNYGCRSIAHHMPGYARIVEVKRGGLAGANTGRLGRSARTGRARARAGAESDGRCCKDEKAVQPAPQGRDR